MKFSKEDLYEFLEAIESEEDEEDEFELEEGEEAEVTAEDYMDFLESVGIDEDDVLEYLEENYDPEFLDEARTWAFQKPWRKRGMAERAGRAIKRTGKRVGKRAMKYARKNPGRVGLGLMGAGAGMGALGTIAARRRNKNK